ncbi:bacteriocin-like protein [Chryseobacterium taiwanense]|uniref:Bacteriocin n=1 Tax=Chryseobacterium taiwanense TaxID=363331 RepID=A0A0B4DC54_9FLAO|nr:hypothetical protein [Chryseobacterium taiwanense]KIC61905.1 hypothetical protein RM51_16190 [Chryseobacterium taiwanense]
MKNIKKLKRKDLKNVIGGDTTPTRIVCLQLITQFVEALPEDYCAYPENAAHIACQCKRLYGL